jgi:hypothetical protein
MKKIIFSLLIMVFIFSTQAFANIQNREVKVNAGEMRGLDGVSDDDDGQAGFGPEDPWSTDSGITIGKPSISIDVNEDSKMSPTDDDGIGTNGGEPVILEPLPRPRQETFDEAQETTSETRARHEIFSPDHTVDGLRGPRPKPTPDADEPAPTPSGGTEPSPSGGGDEGSILKQFESVIPVA